MARVFGIDLGTTASLIAQLEGGRPRLVPNRHGQLSTPSVVGLSPSGRLLVGREAKAQLVEHPERTLAEVKRLMGTDQAVRLGDRAYSPTEISALILRSLKDDAEAFLGEPVEEAVVTVPAYFTDPQRKATKRAGELAGLVVERIINEPTAAALAYGLDNLDKEQLVLVYDLGGGTLDVSLLEMFDGVLEVKASAGNNRLGGSDIDRMLVEHLASRAERAQGPLRKDLRAMAQLLLSAEQAKVALSATASTVVSLPELVRADGSAAPFQCELTRVELESLVRELVLSTLRPVETVLSDAKVARSAVSEIVLVGGASRMPLVRQLVAEFFGKEPLTGIEPEHAIALGAAVQAGLKSGAISAQTGIMITDVAPFTLGVEVQGSAGSQAVGGLFSPIIPRNSTIPVSRTESYATTADGQRQVQIRVYQGESRFVRNNVYLDEYLVDGVPPAPAGREKVNVTFAYDLNGILQVTTTIASTGKAASLTVRGKAKDTPTGEDAVRARLDREWREGGAAPAPAAPPANDGLAQLVAAAEARLAGASGPAASELAAALTEARAALATGDANARRAADERLTDALFELT